MKSQGEFTMVRYAVILLLILLLMSGGCLGPRQQELSAPAPVPTIIAPTPIPVQTIVPPTESPGPDPVPAMFVTATPRPTPPSISEEALNARLVDARNKLNNFIDSDVADTVIIHPDSSQGCEIKKSRELGYLIDATTGESTFIKGDYWSIDSGLFSNPMRKDHEYVIIHTHPRMWTTCPGSMITSLYTFSTGDLEATANLTEQGYQIKYLVAIADKEYRIYPRVRGEWKNERQIKEAVNRIEWRLGTSFTYYDVLLDREFYDVDNLMPFLAKELNYTYTANNHVLA
jgi:hypothetical protein